MGRRRKHDIVGLRLIAVDGNEPDGKRLNILIPGSVAEKTGALAELERAGGGT